MRSLWLASAALVVTTGMACAQTTPAPAETAPGMEPGNMAPPGAMSPGTMSGPQSSPGSGAKGMAPHHHQAHTPADGSTMMYLHIADQAIHHHNRAQADEALSRAETRMLTRTVLQTSGPAADTSPDVTAVENARAALRKGDWAEAAQDTKMAMQQHGTDNEGTGNMAPAASSNMMSPDTGH